MRLYITRIFLFKIYQSNFQFVKSTESALSNMKQKTSCMEISSDSSRSKIADSLKQLGDMEGRLKTTTKTEDGKLPEVHSH